MTRLWLTDLGEDEGHASSDGLGPVEHGLLAQEEDLPRGRRAEGRERRTEQVHLPQPTTHIRCLLSTFRYLWPFAGICHRVWESEQSAQPLTSADEPVRWRSTTLGRPPRPGTVCTEGDAMARHTLDAARSGGMMMLLIYPADEQSSLSEAGYSSWT